VFKNSKLRIKFNPENKGMIGKGRNVNDGEKTLNCFEN
jgi:hypothetical protein